MNNLKLNTEENFEELFNRVTKIIDISKTEVLASIYNSMTKTYYLIGQQIVEEEQSGNKRAEYGKRILENLSIRLKIKYGRGYSKSSLKEYRQFYLEVEKSQTLSGQLKFPLAYSLYQIIFSLTEPQRTFYEHLSIKEKFSVRELEQAIKSSTYERFLNKDKNALIDIKNMSKSLTVATNPVEKDPLVLDFLGIQRGVSHPERELEQKIIDNLERFLLEIGKGFAFLGRQSRVTISGKHFYLDLVFYHVILKCYVIIDLKKGSFNHQDAGQMSMYVNYYDSEVKGETDSPTIGIILCAEKDKNVVEFTLKNNNQVFATQYLTYLPTKDELIELVDSGIEQYESEKHQLLSKESPELE